jgi:short-chain fatty acids transporter
MNRNSLFTFSPFNLAVWLTALAFAMGMIFTGKGEHKIAYFFELGFYWTDGIWGLLEFTMQMALILILGHTLALAPLTDKLTSKLATACNSNTKAAVIVAAVSMITALLNWGLGLIVGAILARKVGEAAVKKGYSINYPLIGAAGYSGLMVWHGGLSGSAPLTVAQEGHFLEGKMGLISISETLFSNLNITATTLVILLALVFFYWQSQKPTKYSNALQNKDTISHPNIAIPVSGDWIAGGLGLFLLLFSVWELISFKGSPLMVFSLNYVNLLLLALCLLAHKSSDRFLSAVERSIGISSGIIIQFPLYAGIMGIMKDSGMVFLFSDWISALSSEKTLTLFTFLSAALTNLLVPSGGGQWALQGPVLVEAAQQLEVAKPLIVMAMAYGDQVTNMLQPFWALPVLSITGIPAKEIFRYSSRLMLIGILVFSLALVLF